MSNGDETRYQVKLAGTPDELRRLAEMGLTPEEDIIVLMTQDQYRMMPGADDIRNRLAHRRDLGEGLSFVTSAWDAGYFLDDLLEAYNGENPGSPYLGHRDPDTFTAAESMALVRTVARCLNMEMKIRPEDSGSTVTQVMEEEGLSPAAVFQPGE